MVNKLKTYDGVGEIFIVDNGSTYEPLLEWYDTFPCEIVRCHNIGHTAPWASGLVSKLNAEFYVVTDSDLNIDSTPKDSLLYLKEKMLSLNLNKIGFGLEWQTVTESSPYYDYLQINERQRWESSQIVQDIAVNVPIDTTFSLSNVQNYFIGGGSTFSPYTAQHKPWFINTDKLTDAEVQEYKYYTDHAEKSSTYKHFLQSNRSTFKEYWDNRFW